MNAVIEVEKLAKRYYLGRDVAHRRGSGAQTEFWALRDVSFTVQRGEVVGIVGRNGAGKSTLLKILSRITEPTSGRARLRGRVASLLEVGTGFHPDLTGHENIFLNGAILGMKRAEIARKFDEIVAFAEIERFLDTPVKRYSSGMYVRLAFAVAAHLEPEILIIDEVLAVGDSAFQKKCLGKMDQVARGGRTVLFVSHNMSAVQSLCSHAILLEEGQVAATGAPQPVLARYLQRGGEDAQAWSRDVNAPNVPLQFESAHARVEELTSSQKLHLELGLRSTAPHRPAFVAVDIFTALGGPLMQALPTVTPFITDAHRLHTVRITIELPPLIPGHYLVTLWTGAHYTETYDCIERALGFEIETSPTKERTFAHSPDHGHIVPESALEYIPGEEHRPPRNR